MMIEMKNLTKRFGGQTVLKDLSVTLPETGLVCIYGESGCGKTTLFHIISGFDSDYSGSVRVGGRELNGLNDAERTAYRQNVAANIFQDYKLLNGYTVRENVALACCAQSGTDFSAAKRKAEQVIGEVGLEHRADVKIETLSGGEKQRAAIARALVVKPRMILADEPTGSLDSANTEKVMELLTELAKDRLVVVVTHDEELKRYAGIVLKLKNGKMEYFAGKKVEQMQGSVMKLTPCRPKTESLRFALKNIGIHLGKLLPIFFIVAFSVAAFITSLNFSDMSDGAMRKFVGSNEAYNKVFLPMNEADEELFNALSGNEKIGNVYYRYRIPVSGVAAGGVKVTIENKRWQPESDLVMVHGRLPKNGSGEIAISPSLAKKLEKNSLSLVGKEIQFSYFDKNGAEITINATVSGIFSHEYDDYVLSDVVERQVYQAMELGNVQALTFDILRFEDIAGVIESLPEGIEVKSSYDEIKVLEQTFSSYRTIFVTVSSVILAVGVAGTAALLVKYAFSRKREIGILRSLGYHAGFVRKLFLTELAVLCAAAALGIVAMIYAFVGVYYLIFHSVMSVSVGNFLIGGAIGLGVILLADLFVLHKTMRADIVKNLSR